MRSTHITREEGSSIVGNGLLLKRVEVFKGTEDLATTFFICIIREDQLSMGGNGNSFKRVFSVENIFMCYFEDFCCKFINIVFDERCVYFICFDFSVVIT